MNVGGVSKLYNLSAQRRAGALEVLEDVVKIKRSEDKELQELGCIENISRFGDPEEYIGCGYWI